MMERQTIWSQLLRKYQKDSETGQLVFVKYIGASDARVQLYVKDGGGWDCLLDTRGYVGKCGIDKTCEGDCKTPTGIFGITGAFGIKKNPGSKLPYTQINENLYWCADRCYYNRLIDITRYPHACAGEHLISYAPQYHYGLFLDYNPDCIYGKGSAIFLHVKSRPYTQGCVAVEESAMVQILQNVDWGAKVCVFPDQILHTLY